MSQSVKSRKVVVGLLAVLALVAGAWGWRAFGSRPKWNVLVVTFDTTRADHIGCYGHASAETPAFDTLASRGVLFERASTPAPLTLPAHATMFTGLLPPEHGLITNGKGRLPEDVITLAEILSEEGYRTGAFVGAFVLDSKFGLDQGFETYDDDLSGTPRPADILHRERPGNTVVDAALEWLGANADSRFHCWIHLYDPHLPYVPHTEEFGQKFVDAPYDGEIAFADRQLARVVQYLESEGLADNTLIVLAGDHGEGLDEHGEHGHGYLLHQSTLHVPLVVVCPAAAARSQRVQTPVSLADLFPTLLELLQLSAPEDVSGISLAGAWRNESISSRDLFGMTDEPFLDNGWAPLRSLTTAQWKYIRTPKPELYDLVKDPGETSNLASSLAEAVEELEARLADLEAGMNVREAQAIELSAAEKRTLASLGYTGGISKPSAESGTPRADIKDKLPLYNQLSNAVTLIEERRLAEAEPLLRQIVQEDPIFRKALGNLGICLALQGKTDEAIEWYQRVLEIDAADASALMNLAAAYATLGRIEDAVRHYESAMIADKDSPVPAFQLAMLYQEIGDIRQVETLLAEALRRDPTFDPAIRVQGDLAMARGDLELAGTRYEAALHANPRSVPTLVNMGILAARQQQLETAEQYFRRALTVDPKDPLARQNLGRVFLYRGQPLEAAAQFEAILADFPDRFETILALGWMRAAHPEDPVRDGRKALELAEHALQLSKRQSIDALDLCAAAYAELGRFDEAIEAVDEALERAAEVPRYPVNALTQRRALYQQRRPYRSTGHHSSGG